MNIDDTHRKRLKLNKKWIRYWNIILFIISMMKIKRHVKLDDKISFSILSVVFRALYLPSLNFLVSSCLYLKEDSQNIIIFMMKMNADKQIITLMNFDELRLTKMKLDELR